MVKIENRRTSSLHEVETHTMSTRPGALLFGTVQDFMTSHSVISSTATKSDLVTLVHGGNSSGQTVEIQTTTTFFDATQTDANDHTRYEGPKEVMYNAYEVDLP